MSGKTLAKCLECQNRGKFIAKVIPSLHQGEKVRRLLAAWPPNICNTNTTRLIECLTSPRRVKSEWLSHASEKS